MKKIDLNADILKILASLVVIISHIPKLAYLDGDKISLFYLQFMILVSISINIFFLISGFFIYNNNDTVNNLKKIFINYIKNIFLPFIIILFIVLSIEPYLMGDNNIIYCITNFHPKAIIKKILYSIIHLSNVNLGFIGGHMWYVYSYFYIILFYPIIHFIIKNTNEKFKIVSSIFILVFMCIKDILVFNMPNVNLAYQYVIYPPLLSYIGYNLYHIILKKYHENKKNISNILPIFIIIYSLINIIYYAYNIISPYHVSYYESWVSTAIILSSIIFIILLYKLRLVKNGEGIKFFGQYNKNISLFIHDLSSNNIYIYLIHPYILLMLNMTPFSIANKYISSFHMFSIIWYLIISIIIMIIIGVPVAYIRKNK